MAHLPEEYLQYAQQHCGEIMVVDRKGLEALSDPSYGVPEAEYARLVLKGIPVTP